MPHSAGSEKSPLLHRRALVPPSRPGVHPLQRMLERAGVFVVAFPRIEAQEIDAPCDALDRWREFDWVVLSGAPSASRFLRHAQIENGASTRIATVGAGATAELRRAGLRPDTVPRRHTADEVAGALELRPNQRVLLVRERGASRALPERVREFGASPTEVEGYRMRVLPDEPASTALRNEPLDFVAFANPTAVRLLQRGLEDFEVGWRPDPARTGIAAAGPATAKAAEAAGWRPTIVAGGRLRSLVETLVARCGC